MRSTEWRLRGLSVLAAALLSVSPCGAQLSVTVTNAAELMNAVNNGAPGTTVNVAAGVYELTSSLRVKSGMTIAGAGAGLTTVRNSATFQFVAAPSYDADVNFEYSNPNAYLFDLGRDQANIALRDMTLTGPQVYGGVHAVAVTNVTLTGIHFSNFMWSGVRVYVMTNATITNNRFTGAGGQTVNADGSFGVTGGSVYLTYLSNSVIANNRFERGAARTDNVFGIKGREFRSVDIINNTVVCDFAIELPFENDYYVDIENNYLDGVVSLPRYAGGQLPPTGSNPYTFRILRNYFTKSYSVEGPHNGMTFAENVFDFPVDSDYGNLFSSFDPYSESPAASGPLEFSNNIVINPGRGVFWSDVVWNNLSFINNHILCNELAPSQYPDGLFSFRESSPALGGQATDYATITIADNVVRVIGQARSLIRQSSGYGANISNNQLINVSDGGSMANPQTNVPRGLVAPLTFDVGVNGEFHVDGAALLARAALVGCPADINRSGNLTVQDIFDFLAAYFGGQPAADFNGSGANSVQDIFDFLAAYFAGCV